MSLNKVMLIGNVGADPEIRYLEGNPSDAPGSQTKVASLRLATTERYRDRMGELRENTEWHSITAWRGSADIVEKYVKKGTQLYIEGRLRTRDYTDQSGVRRYRTEILADTIQLLGRRGDNPASSDAAGGQQGYAAAQNPAYRQAPPQQSYAPQQSSYAAPQPPPAYQQQPAPQPVAPVDVAMDNPDDDLPF